MIVNAFAIFFEFLTKNLELSVRGPLIEKFSRLPVIKTA
jgi:hypothetical protein